MEGSGTGKVIIVQGGQWGSEAKGLITHKLTIEKRPTIAIRTGTVNAGHTVYHQGRPYAMQQIPVSWVDENVALVLGPGAYIHPEILRRELDWIEQATGSLRRVYVDYRCGLHLPSHTKAAAVADRHHKMGATGKGCSEAVVGKISTRGQDNVFNTFHDWYLNSDSAVIFRADKRIVIMDTVTMVNKAYDRGETLILEGTQGTLLDLHLGPYPYTTHKQTQAASWLAEAGLSANVNKEIWGVYRTYPIRVAGNSGPMPGEISWVELATKINERLPKPLVAPWALEEFGHAVQEAHDTFYPQSPTGDPATWGQDDRENFREAASEIHAKALERLSDRARQELYKLFEITTVTKKLRRIADWDWDMFEESIMLNRPDYIALTFMNYRRPDLWGAGPVNGFNGIMDDTWVDEVERYARCPIGIVSFGPQIEHTHLTRAEATVAK